MPSGRGNPFRASGPFAPAGRGKRAEKGACDFTDAASCRPESIQYFHFPPYFPTSIFSTELCGLGERPLVFELGHQY